MVIFTGAANMQESESDRERKLKKNPLYFLILIFLIFFLINTNI